MHRRPLLASAAAVIAGLSGCSALIDSSGNPSNENNDDEEVNESPHAMLPDSEPRTTESLGQPDGDADPHVVFVQNAAPPRSVEVRVLRGEYLNTVHAEQYPLARDEHVRIELWEPDAYAVAIYDGDERIGDPIEIDADWFEYDCPATVIAWGEDQRLTASTSPNTDVC